MDQLLKELKRRIEAEHRPSTELYAAIRQLGVQMFLTNTMGRESVLVFCSCMLKLYSNLAEKGKEGEA